MLNKIAVWVIPVCMLSAQAVVASPDEYKDEYGARGPMSFEAMDLDGDGLVTPEEHAAVRKERQSYREEQGRPMRNKDNAPTFDEIDTDGDGAISRDEWASCHKYRGR